VPIEAGGAPSWTGTSRRKSRLRAAGPSRESAGLGRRAAARERLGAALCGTRRSRSRASRCCPAGQAFAMQLRGRAAGQGERENSHARERALPQRPGPHANLQWLCPPVPGPPGPSHLGASQGCRQTCSAVGGRKSPSARALSPGPLCVEPRAAVPRAARARARGATRTSPHRTDLHPGSSWGSREAAPPPGRHSVGRASEASRAPVFFFACGSSPDDPPS